MLIIFFLVFWTGANWKKIEMSFNTLKWNEIIIVYSILQYAENR